MNILDLIKELACPACKGDLEYDDGLRCTSCDQHYEVQKEIPYMTLDDMARFKEEIEVQDHVAAEYEQVRYQNEYAKRYHNWWTSLMLSQVSVAGRILDNGCGIGNLFEMLPADRIVGIDLSTEMLKHAAKRSTRLVLGNSQQLPFKDNSFDLVFCRSLLHHLPQPELAVKEMYRTLKSAGEVVLADTNTSLLSALPRTIAVRGRHFSHEHKNLNRHILEKLLKPYFSIDKVLYFGYIAYPVLGFPDMTKLFKFVPFKPFAATALMCLDKAISHIPLVRTQSWGIIIKATALEKPILT
ncbi:MAG: methyltransferase domain-containing protein [Planctomycetota bacterium]|jgi:ubiquinone/menaquinone biosynthesis C-methylase UbiE